MSISETLLPEFDQEMTMTRRLLERVPSDKGEWKPHPKSFSLGAPRPTGVLDAGLDHRIR